ncbi:ABC transporter ATP-binding protein [Dolosicoccus paucivorans]|uniref:ABC transporter ATP-binding protein n=1 Tax=Dolosicoccus paucivorans TaxID=84521 RepID=A0A1G8MLV1_9LACT|nr:ABC transporter ATP-binding protein [Dolosicoccus paucivorans]PMB83794.1 ABC transporter ATP-binding protein [Dolosicoccus paucivorans]PMC57923.1 ABC transporter ATP-binding protein [Dolosicoccus paucivorans]SDI68826.1 ABC-2 type transport system ATP-binding protein [Dolosicoccus paucivorans]
MLLNVEQVNSGYRQVPVIQDITFSIQPGEMVGLIGLNGAGKTTLLKTILGLLTPQKGQIEIDGATMITDHEAYASQVAYIPETPVLYEELTLKEHIMMTALGYNIDPEEAMRRAEPLLKLFRLERQLNWFPIYFSKGMKQKVMIICALITKAKLLIVDEPFIGLDPLAINHFKQLLKDYTQSGGSVLFTTHILSIAQELCDRYLILSHGKLIATGTLDEVSVALGMTASTADDLYLALAERAEEE